MSSFNTRLAVLADQVRALEGGADLARALIALAADMDAYLVEQNAARYRNDRQLMLKWNEFMNESITDAHAYHARQQSIFQRQIAQQIAADPRWQGGYADALKLLAHEETNG